MADKENEPKAPETKEDKPENPSATSDSIQTGESTPSDAVNAEERTSTEPPSPEIKADVSEKDKSEEKADDKTATVNEQESINESQNITGENAAGEAVGGGEDANTEEQGEAANDEIIEEEKQEFKRRKGDDKPLIPDDFFYEYDELKFRPIISEDSKIPEGLINLFHSFGYDCKKRSNLNILDAETLVFSAGNFVQILNMKTREQKYIRTTSGGAVGAIAVHPSKKYFAVGEKGNMPNINIYEYPSLKLYRVLRQGTVKGYAHLDFSKNGDLLGSLGGVPDFMLTLWDWKQENVVLRTKAFSQDVYKVTFSKDLKGILTTAGTGHIKFWKMANTFTGFKLQGELGKFGKTEISDIEGYAELPDGKVLSGCEWGNMLLWDGGLIQTEICRNKTKSCHVGSIQQITLDEGDIYTIGGDGSIRVWDFETIDTAEPSEEGVKLEIEPLNELVVGKNVALKSMVKDCVEESTIWYAQDSNGGIWKLDLSFSASSEDPKQLFNYHAGIIRGIDTCPNSHLFATTADDGSVKVYNYLNKDIVVQRKFTKGGTCLKWLPQTIDPEGSTIMSGFQDGVLRFLKVIAKTPDNKDDCGYQMILAEVFKPHVKTITAFAIDAKGELIATGSEDKTVFFFSNKSNTRKPIGFVNVPSVVTFMCWTPSDYQNNRLLVCMADGSVYEYEAPIVDKYDTSKTYLIEMQLPFRKYKFKSIKSRLRHEEELERKRKEEEERKKKEEEERRIRGIEEAEEKKKKGEDGKEEEKAKKEEQAPEEGEEEAKPKVDEWKPYIPETPSKIYWAHYSSPDTFWLSMDAFDAGYLYECRFLSDAEKTKIAAEQIDEPFGSVPVEKSDLTHAEDIPLTCLTFNKMKTHAFIGQKNGVLRYQPVPDSKSIRDLKNYWSYGFHDNDYGRITHICMSFDERFVFSVGADSNIFGFVFIAPPEAIEKAKAERIRLPSKSTIVEKADIDDPNAYSIEQEKQKSEHDKMIAEAEGKKKEMRQKIHHLRKSFKELLTKNDQLVPRLRLGKHDFMLEESIKEQILNQIDDKIKLTYRELAWYSEKCRLSLEKVKSRFKDIVDCEHLIVYSFDDAYQVATFRTVQLPRDIDEFEAELIRHNTLLLLEKQKTKENQDLANSSDKRSTGENSLQNFNEQYKSLFSKLRGNTAARVERALRKMEEKKLRRLKRKKEWEELMSARLPDGYENADDLAVIKYAEDNLGDFKLKTDPNYVVGEEQRMNVFKATRRLIAIKQALHKNQMVFNKKVIDLRNRKVNLVDEINKDIDRLEEIQFILSQQQGAYLPPRPRMKPDEMPEKQTEYNKEKLLEFKKELELREGSLVKAGHDDDGGFGGFASGASAPKKNAQAAIETANSQDNQAQSKLRFDHLKPLWHNKDIMTATMKQKAQAMEIKLVYEQKQILKKIEEKIAVFNAELNILRHEQGNVGVLLKNIDLRHVTLYEEFILLKDFEKTENELELKLQKRKDEYNDMQVKLTEIQAKIDAKRKDIEKLDEQQKQLMDTYQHMTKGETKFADFLTKVYKRRIKRKKKVDGEEGEEDSDEESEEEDEDDEDEDEEDDDSEAEGQEQLDLDMCPNGLSQALYDDVCKLRDNKLDLEEKQVEEKKIAELLKKDQESAIKKAKLVENTLKQAQQDLENFQKEKQKKLNDLDIAVTMHFDQMQLTEKGYLPSDLSEALVFDSRNLERLQNRIKELQAEKVAEKKTFKNLKEKHVNLIRDKKKMDEYLERLEESSNKMMVDKFGKIVDIEKLELIAVNQQIEELKQRISENEFEHERVMKEWLKKINEQKDESIELLNSNTTRVNEMIDLIKEKKSYEKFLNSKQKNLAEEFSGMSRKDVEERERLHTLVQLQAQEVEALKAEISILSRKGGHILPPTQPPTNNQAQVA